MENTNRYTISEEIANAVTHGIGTLLSIVALVVLVVFACTYGNTWHIVSFSIYGATLIILYLNSTLYHSFQNPKVKKVFRILDHSSIYLLIAGTYTPLALITLRGPLGWTIFGIVWGLAFIGIALKAFFVNRFMILSTLFYVAMGWLIIIAIKPLLELLPTGGIVWFIVGGVLYTVGAVFYVFKKLPFNHAVFHLFVLAGSISHFFAILFYVLPLKA